MYDPAIARWHCADPMAENYTNLSPYNYVANNPMIFVDPNGMNIDNYGVDEYGNVSLLEETDDDYDVLYAVDNEGNKKDTDGQKGITEADGQKVEDQTILPELEKTKSDYKDGNYVVRDNNLDTGNLFLFLAGNTKVEWSFEAYQSGNNKLYFLGTNHRTNAVYDGSILPGLNEFNKILDVHSHPGPNGTKGGSSRIGGGDLYKVDLFLQRWKNAGLNEYKFPKYAVYHKETKTMYWYGPYKGQEGIRANASKNKFILMN
jgi:hypothetical protein